MFSHAIRDWDDAYANGANVPNGSRWPDAWVEPAQRMRDELESAGRAKLGLSYGPGDRNRFDLFLPEGVPKGLVVFIHGGYWKSMERSYWSHLAQGSLAHGHAFTVPSYTLCPDIRIAGIVEEIGAAIIAAADLVPGDIRLTGHSAGGHLCARMICEHSPLPQAVKQRVVHSVPIAGVHDLRPIMRTAMNDVLHIDDEEAKAESPALLMPMAGARVTAWVGAAERSEFVRQSALLANIWTGLGARTAFYAEPDTHHFTAIDGLADPDHALTRTLLAD